MSTLSPGNRDRRSPSRVDRRQDLQTAPVIPPLIATVLADEAYYSDDPPTWSSAPTSFDAKKARKRYVKRLKRFSPQFPEAAELANILARCKPRRRCKSGACPECGRAFQRFFVAEVITLASNDSSLQLTAVSIAFQKDRTAEDRLNALQTKGMKRSLSAAIKNADGLAWLVGGIDLSLNDDTQRKLDIAWQPQFYGFAQVTSREVVSKTLGDKYSPSKTAPRPVQVKDCDGSARAISYGFKNDFVRRIAYRGQAGPPGNRRKFWTTRKVSPRATEHVRAMLWLHKIGLGGRLFLKRVRMTRTGDSVGLVKIKKLE
jgi:hypothetical protein